MMHIPLHLFAAALFWDGSHAGTKPRISILHKSLVHQTFYQWIICNNKQGYTDIEIDRIESGSTKRVFNKVHTLDFWKDGQKHNTALQAIISQNITDLMQFRNHSWISELPVQNMESLWGPKCYKKDRCMIISRNKKSACFTAFLPILLGTAANMFP